MSEAPTGQNSPPLFNKVLVANRGEIAVRVIRTLREMGIGAVAVYSEADAGAPHVAMADEAYCLGPAAAAESYLAVDKVLAALRDSGAEAVHPGYGLLSENEGFAVAVAQAGATFIGPPPAAMRAMATKTHARATMQEAGVPVVPGGGLEDAESIGLPLLVKASSGGGGKGMRLVEEGDDLADAIASCQREALKAFGDDTVYLERYVRRPRHVEVQVLGDEHGNVVHMFERECSIQRRHQKVVEETPSPALTPELRAAMGDAAVSAAAAVGYVGAGTVEFLLDEDGSFYFLEMNTRLQVEHPVTEMVVGIDLVAEQIRVAAGEPLGYTQSDLSQRGHAIEVRLYAEDPETFLPQIGVISQLVIPQGPGVRHDAAIYAGWEVSIHYDPMLAKLCVWAPTRPAAIRRMLRALDEYVLQGVVTNLPLLQHVLGHPAFMAGDTTTAFLAEHPYEPSDQPPPDTALIARALETTAAATGATASTDVGDAHSPFTTLGRWGR
ncbi:MAG: acetyl-CoA carboxylase biotin carboxylase subunit [Myxococcota bacterium]|jgi:acetyl-CoA carboxylase biotin carboxylase subunit